VFTYLKENEIGQEHALFYIAYATFLELKGNYAGADKVYQQGINRLATPMDRLRTKFNDFQHRMARRIQRKAQEQARGISESESSHPERQSLSLIRGTSRRNTAPGVGGGGGGGHQEKRKATVTPGKANAPAGELSIFVDEEFGGTSNLESAQNTTIVSKWQSLPTFDQVRKENVQKSSTWTGQRIKQKQAHVAVPAPVLDIPVDDEFASVAMPVNKYNQTSITTSQSLRQRLDKGGSAATIDEKLAHDPLRLHRGPSDGGPLVKQKVEVLAFPPPVAEDLDDPPEMSYEEARALRWRCHEAKSQMPPVAKPDFDARECLPREDEEIEQHAEQQHLQEIGASGDITMTTKGAFDCMNAIFSARYGGDVTLQLGNINPPEIGRVQAEARAAADVGAEDVTITTRAAFEALNVAFGGKTPLDAPQAGAESFSDVEPAIPKDHPALAVNDTLSSGFDDVFVREDTVFLHQKGHTSPKNLNIGDSKGGFMIREDTVFINYNSNDNKKDPGVADAKRDEQQKKETKLFQAHGLGSNIENKNRFRSDDIENDPAIAVAKQLGSKSISDLPDGDATIVLQHCSSETPLTLESDDALQRESDDTTIIINHGLGVGMKHGMESESASRTGLGLSHKMKSMHIAPQQAEHSTEYSGLRIAAVAHGRTPLEDAQDDTRLLTCGPGSDENAPPADETVQPFQNRRRTRAHAPKNAAKALTPLFDIRDDAELLERGIDMERDEDAEKALKRASKRASKANDDEVDEEGFLVYEDHNSTEKGGEPLAFDPFEPAFHGHMLSMLDPPVERWPEVEVLSDEDQALARKFFQTATRTTNNTSLAPLRELSRTLDSTKRSSLLHLQLAGHSYLVRPGCLGSGAYATVFAARQGADDEDNAKLVALKVEEPACPWELYICKVVAGRVEDRWLFTKPSALMLGSQMGILQMPLGVHGSLQDLLNAHLAVGVQPDETIAARLGCNLMRAMSQLHRKARVLHNDIKPDNVLIRQVESDNQQGEVCLGVQLIDFGRSVDLELVPRNCVMVGDSGTEAFRCVEMREESPWLWQADAYGVAGCLHCMLFGDYMQVERVVDCQKVERLRIKAAFPRYWQGELWDKVFTTLLNLPCPLDHNAPPPWEELAGMLESWLEGSKEARRREGAAMQRCLEFLSRSKVQL
jgi:hypothetical protein